MVTGSPKSVVCVATPLFHLKTTWSPVSGVLSFSWSVDFPGGVGSLHAVRGPITQPPIGEHVWQSGQVCSAPPPQTPRCRSRRCVQASSSLHAVPFGLNVHVLVQHDAGVPFAGPSSQSSV